MANHKKTDKVCVAAIILALFFAVFFLCRGILGLEMNVHAMEYEDKIFDTSIVHTIDIEMEDWDEFVKKCASEEYEVCNLTIDGESYKNVAIRGKGNTSLSNVASLNSQRYSFKVEFDHYDEGSTYYGLDKLCLNNIIQDNTYMKDYLTYRMMDEFGVAAPLCSYAYITVNGEEWGLYLAVEGVEEGFLQRNYGSGYGELYKPDSENMGKGMKSSFSDNSDVKLQYIDDDADSYSNIFDNAKTNVDAGDKRRLIQSLKILTQGENIESVVNVDEVLRYFVVHNFVCNEDSYTGTMIHNYYLYEENGQLSMIPWDYNLAYGTFQGNNATETVNSPIDSPVTGTDMQERPMVNWIFADEKYTLLYHEYFEEFLENTDIDGIIEQTRTLISSYVEKDVTKFCTFEEFETGVDVLKEFCNLRKESVLAQLDGTIPSDSEGQKENGIMMIDAPGIDLSDMGTMNGGMGEPDMGNMDFGNMEKPDAEGEFPQMQMPGRGDKMEDKMGDERENTGTQIPDMPYADDKSGATGNWILLGVSFAVLIIGLVIAYKFKGKN